MHFGPIAATILYMYRFRLRLFIIPLLVSLVPLAVLVQILPPARGFAEMLIVIPALALPVLAGLAVQALIHDKSLQGLGKELGRLRRDGRFDVSRDLGPERKEGLLLDELNRLTLELNAMFIDIGRSTRKFNLFASDIYFSSRQLSEQSGQQAEGMGAILGRVRNFREALATLVADIHRVVDELETNNRSYLLLSRRSAQTTRALDDLEQQTVKVSESTALSRKTIEASSESVKDLFDSIQLVDQELRLLGERSSLTGTIIRNLEDIAERTHVLATNASIEAARAGSAGAGFSVIAGEIRTLAGNSRDAIHEVDSMIKQTLESVQLSLSRWSRTMDNIQELQSFIASTLDAMSLVDGQLSGIVESTSAFSRDFSEQTGSMAESIEQSGKTRERILSFTGVLGEQNQGYEEIAHTIETIAAASFEASRSSAVLAQLAGYLRFGGQELKQVAGRFITSQNRLLRGITRKEQRRALMYNLELFEGDRLLGHLGDLSLSGFLLYAEKEMTLGRSREGCIRLPLNFSDHESLAISFTPRRCEKEFDLFKTGCSMSLNDSRQAKEFDGILHRLTIPGEEELAEETETALNAHTEADSADVSELEELY